MRAEDVLEIVRVLEANQIAAWLDGGWGVDALLGAHTRPHQDLDLVVALHDVEKIESVLSPLGFTVTDDERPTRLVMHAATGRVIDLHTVTIDTDGAGHQQLQSGNVYRYSPAGFKGLGRIQEVWVRCLTPEVQMDCHYGYEPDEKDRHDMALLSQRFNLPLKTPYR